MIGATFLHKCQHDIKHQQDGNDRSLVDFTQEELQQDRGFQHPGHRGPEFLQQYAQRMGLLISHGIRAIAGQTLRCLRTGQALPGCAVAMLRLLFQEIVGCWYCDQSSMSASRFV